MLHNQLSVRLPLISISLRLIIWTSYLVNIEMQSSSHNFTIEISEPLFKNLKLYDTIAFSVNFFDSGRITFFVGDIMRTSATENVGPKVSLTLSHMLRSCEIM